MGDQLGGCRVLHQVLIPVVEPILIVHRQLIGRLLLLSILLTELLSTDCDHVLRLMLLSHHLSGTSLALRKWGISLVRKSLFLSSNARLVAEAGQAWLLVLISLRATVSLAKLIDTSGLRLLDTLIVIIDVVLLLLLWIVAGRLLAHTRLEFFRIQLVAIF